jgi:acyl-CoA thioester hydrolase
LLRAAGVNYRDIEEQGIFLVVAEMHCRYYLPAQYDDVLTLRTTTVRAKGARVEHEYRLSRGDDLLAEGHSVVACVDRSGRVRRLPDWLALKRE